MRISKKRKKKVTEGIKNYALITFGILLTVIGTYFFKFPNNFSFGGVTGLAVVLAQVLPVSASTVNFLLTILLLIIGFIFLGKSFGIRTVYASLLLSAGLSLLQYFYPLSAPLTDQPMLELTFAIVLPGLGSALLFNIGASSGGTDIVALILKKYTRFNIGNALIFSDMIVTCSSYFVFDLTTALFSTMGLFAKSIVVDNVIEHINMCKYVNVVCSDPKPICEYITDQLKHSATICPAQGAFTGKDKFLILTVLKRYQAIALRRFIKQVEPDAFITITNTSEIIGRGFHGLD